MLLSICIPTAFRGEHLEKTLRSLISEIAPYNDVEVIVCDNSEEQKALPCVLMLSSSKIKYLHSKSVGFRNSIASLNAGSGRFLKLHNDTMEFREGALKEIYDLCLEMERLKIAVTLIQNQNTHKKSKTYYANPLNLIEKSGLLCTWSNALLISKNLLNLTITLDQYFPQLSLLLDLRSDAKTMLYKSNLFKLQFVHRKGGYNIFKVFAQDLDSIFTKSKYKNMPDSITRELINSFFPIVVFKNVITRIEKYDSANWSLILISRFGFLNFIKILILSLCYPLLLLLRRLND